MRAIDRFCWCVRYLSVCWGLLLCRGLLVCRGLLMCRGMLMLLGSIGVSGSVGASGSIDVWDVSAGRVWWRILGLLMVPGLLVVVGPVRAARRQLFNPHHPPPPAPTRCCSGSDFFPSSNRPPTEIGVLAYDMRIGGWIDCSMNVWGSVFSTILNRMSTYPCTCGTRVVVGIPC